MHEPTMRAVRVNVKITEVKQSALRIVLTWVTIWDPNILSFFSLAMISKNIRQIRQKTQMYVYMYTHIQRSKQSVQSPVIHHKKQIWWLDFEFQEKFNVLLNCTVLVCMALNCLQYFNCELSLEMKSIHSCETPKNNLELNLVQHMCLVYK